MRRTSALLGAAGLLSLLGYGLAHPLDSDRLARKDVGAPDENRGYSCFPALNFNMPPVDELPEDPAWWWCNPSTEYAFLGFSYEVTPCMQFTYKQPTSSDIQYIRPKQRQVEEGVPGCEEAIPLTLRAPVRCM